MAKFHVELVGDKGPLVSSLAAIVSTISSCGSRVTNCINSNRSAIENRVMSIVIVGPAGTRSYEEFNRWLNSEQNCTRVAPVLVVAEDPDDFASHQQWLAKNVLDVVTSPVNLQRIRYLVESSLIKTRHLQLQQTNFGSESDSGSSARSPFEVKIQKATKVDCNVLLSGETGVGKSYFASQIHQNSCRRKSPFVVVNCANISHELFESELFGHAKGAFTGADQQRVGQLEFAGNGTVFLDEINSLPFEMQAKLLRVVDNREFRPVGENRLVELNARILSATNEPIEKLVSNGTFRADLYYRLAMYQIEIPPLRERIDEIEKFCQHFVDRFAQENNVVRPALDDELLKLFCQYDWPGNLRELRNCIYHGAIDSENNVISTENLPRGLHSIASDSSQRQEEPMEPKGEISRVDGPEYRNAYELVKALEKHNFNRSRAAEELGVTRMTIYNRMKRMGII